MIGASSSCFSQAALGQAAVGPSADTMAATGTSSSKPGMISSSESRMAAAGTGAAAATGVATITTDSPVPWSKPR